MVSCAFFMVVFRFALFVVVVVFCSSSGCVCMVDFYLWSCCGCGGGCVVYELWLCCGCVMNVLSFCYCCSYGCGCCCGCVVVMDVVQLWFCLDCSCCSVKVAFVVICGFGCDCVCLVVVLL